MQKTKIIATLGPACYKPKIASKMIKAGLSVLRLNMSHLSSASTLKKNIKIFRKEAKTLNKNIAIMMDLSGPKVRVAEQTNIKIIQNINYTIGYKNSDILLDKPLIFKKQNGSSLIKIDDGKISFKILKLSKHQLVIKALDSGYIASKKGVNFPGVTLNLPSVTKTDKDNLKLAVELKIDWLAQSFVRSQNNILPIQRILKSYKIDIPIIAKIETVEAIKNLDSIIKKYNGILVARGDLGVEMTLSDLPRLQKHIINKCIYYKKPCIVATQMLESMISQSSPTRAEVNDVANAIYDGVDAVMLSAETAVGLFPVESVEMMHNICVNIESDHNTSNFNRNIIDSLSKKLTNNYLAICSAACFISNNLDIQIIVVLTDSGKTAIQMAQFRPKANIVAITNSSKTYNQLSMIWGIIPFKILNVTNINTMYKKINKQLADNLLIKSGENFVLSSGEIKSIKNSTNMLQIYQAK